ncbi:ArsR/SmtB family transcription factor [Streptomyces sp. SP18CS02]|uniref:ArsR/SmtB family transcription factor n=1 Tax=Streptomyces sp. SP18CS02 TaxID=3002531 RepID=UPI002E78414D|nr:helix-turn-helix domain-containing protein [Streptomyces sp. SP18CS02]MEE1752171.1 helix-turn-helix domain-containing protein [Streptomyces sp. SP18CS02]
MDFSGGELSRLRVAAGLDPLWETALSLHLLQNRQAAPAFGTWRREVRTALDRAGLAPATRALMRLCPATDYFPDFLTPGRGGTDFDTVLDQVLSTPRRRLAAELSRLHARTPGPVPSGVRSLAEGRPEALRRLGWAMRRYYEVAVEPYLPAMRAQAAADRAGRAEAALAGGAEGLLAGYGAMPGWSSDGRSLRAPYPLDRELRLEGRPLTFVPSFFCVHAPLALVDDALPPVLVHPLSPAPGPPSLPRRGDAVPSTAQLIGSSRARLLRLLDSPMTTTGIAAALGLASSTASRHVSVLREAGLLASHRRGVRVMHRRTPLGEAVLTGAVR